MLCVCFFKQKTAYEMRISDWSSDVCSSDLSGRQSQPGAGDLTPEALAQMQEELRRRLGDFMRKLGEGNGRIPQPFGDAERSMKEAGDALARAQPGEAVGPQGDENGRASCRERVCQSV